MWRYMLNHAYCNVYVFTHIMRKARPIKLLVCLACLLDMKSETTRNSLSFCIQTAIIHLFLPFLAALGFHYGFKVGVLIRPGSPRETPYPTGLRSGLGLPLGKKRILRKPGGLRRLGSVRRWGFRRLCGHRIRDRGVSRQYLTYQESDISLYSVA